MAETLMVYSAVYGEVSGALADLDAREQLRLATDELAGELREALKH